MKIRAREIGNGQPCYIIAEAGTNHGGSLIGATQHVMAAKNAGADAVKFQIFAPDEPLFCPIEGDERRWKRWNATAMEPLKWELVKDICDKNGITFLASAFQPSVVNWLKKIDVAAYKVASRAAATYPYDAVPGPFIISDGMRPGIPVRPSDVQQIIILQCEMAYPTPLAKARWSRSNGLSDHSGTIWPGLDAMARGCPMLEIHFAIDKANAGNDAPVCLTVDQLKLLCEARDAFAALRSPAR
jgi:sialic acid synthase SpsE